MATTDTLKIDVVLNGKKADDWLKKFNKNLQGIQKVAKKNNAIFKDFLRLAGFAGFVKATHDAMNLGHSLEVLSQKSGLASSKILQMDNAARKLGVDAGRLQSSIGSLSTRYNLARMGRDPQFFTLMAKYGTASRGQSFESMLYSVADYAMRTQQARGDITPELMAEAISQDLQIPYEMAVVMASKGAKGLKELFNAASTIDDESSKKLDSMKKAWNGFLVEMETSFDRSISKTQPFFNGIMEFAGNIFKEYGDIAWLTLATEGLIGLTAGLKGVAGGASILSGAVIGLGASLKGAAIAVGGLGVWESFSELGGAFGDLASGRSFWSGSQEEADLFQKYLEDFDRQLKAGNTSLEAGLVQFTKPQYKGYFNEYLRKKLHEGFAKGKYGQNEIYDLAERYGIINYSFKRYNENQKIHFIPEAGIEKIDPNAPIRGDIIIDNETNVIIKGSFDDPQEAGEVIGDAVAEKISANLWMMANSGASLG